MPTLRQKNKVENQLKLLSRTGRTLTFPSSTGYPIKLSVEDEPLVSLPWNILRSYSRDHDNPIVSYKFDIQDYHTSSLPWTHLHRLVWLRAVDSEIDQNKDFIHLLNHYELTQQLHQILRSLPNITFINNIRRNCQRENLQATTLVPGLSPTEQEINQETTEAPLEHKNMDKPTPAPNDPQSYGSLTQRNDLPKFLQGD